MKTFLVVPCEANAPNGGHRIHVCTCVRPSRIRVVLCVRDRFTYLHILGTNQLHNHCKIPFILILTSFSDPGQGHKKLSQFFCILCIRPVVLCVRDSAQIAKTASHICTYLVPRYQSIVQLLYKLLNKRNPYLTSVAYYLDFGNYNPHYLVPNCSVINLESNDGNHKRFA